MNIYSKKNKNYFSINYKFIPFCFMPFLLKFDFKEIRLEYSIFINMISSFYLQNRFDDSLSPYLTVLTESSKRFSNVRSEDLT